MITHMPFDGNNWKSYESAYQPLKKFPDSYRLMRVVGMESGRSAKRLVLEDEDGVQYPMFIGDFVKAMKGQHFTDISIYGFGGTWTVSKRGANYGVKPIPMED